MKKILNPRLLGAITVASLLAVANVPAQPFGQWDFNTGNLNPTAGVTAGALQYADGDTTTGTAFGTTTSFGIPDINGAAAQVMRFPVATNTMGYFMPTPPANGGGSTVNEYTIIFDVLYPASGTVRPLVDTDGSLFVAGADLIVNAAGGIGVPPNGPFDGTIAPNTWYRIAFAVTPTEVRKYINGAEVGSQAGAGFEGRLSLDASAISTRILANTVGDAALGYVNSIQLRDVALSGGQIGALGGPSAAGIPLEIPAVPSFIVSRTPGTGATGVGPQPEITVVLDQGDTTITSSSIQIALDGVNLTRVITPTPPTYTATAQTPTVLDPNSAHTLQVTWQDSVAGSKTNTWSFTVANYQNVTLPAPFYVENFEAVAEGAMPAGWVVTNNTSTDVAGYDLNNARSDAYKDFVVISRTTIEGITQFNPEQRLMLPPIVLNGAIVPSLVDGNFVYGESDSRSANQVQVMFTHDINCTGRSNIFVAWKSTYTQNQDNIASVEYSIDGGANWLPVIYYIDDKASGGDVIRTNDVIDIGATLGTPRGDQAYGLAYSNYIGAPVSTALTPYIAGRIDDNQLDGKRIEVVRLPQADNAATVRFRFGQAGTASWFFGIDDFGLYEVNTPVIIAQPQNRTINATESTTFSVAATSPTPLTYQWQRNGVNLSNAGHYSGVNTDTLTVSNAEPEDAGSYRCIVSNDSGPVNSSLATLTVIDAPSITVQPSSVLVSAGFPASFSVSAMGRPPLSYQWLHDGAPVGGATSTLTLASTVAGDAGQYRVVITNVTGATTSSVVVLTVVSAGITDALVAHLKFDNDYNDASGRGNHATPIGAPAFNTGGRLGQAFQYTTSAGVEQHYATLGYPEDLQFGSSTDFSIAFWSKIAPGSKSSDPAILGNKNWGSGNNTGYVLGVQGNNNFEWNYREEAPNTRKDFDSAINMTDGEWRHVVFSVQRGVVARTIIDGVLVDTRAIVNAGNAPTSIDTTLAVNIGQDGTGVYGASVTNALIDDVGFWRRALTTQEAQAIYNASFSGKNLAEAEVGGTVTPPQITVQPVAQVASDGAPASFSVTATGGVPITYQWRFWGTNIGGAVGSTYSIAAASSANVGEYSVVVSNPGGSVTSSVVTLSVVSLPVISAQPQSRTNNQNLDVSFSVTASGGALEYQWKHNAVDIPGATEATLYLHSIYPAQAGAYTVEVRNSSGPVLSDPATLTVIAVPPPRLTGQWDFQNGDLAATLGLPLDYFDTKVQTDTTFGTTTSLGIGNIAGAPASVLRFVHSSSPWGGYKMSHNASPNGGGAYVNQYTIVFDVYYPAASNGRWRSFFQTATGNNNDGEFFVNTANGIGISGNYQGNVTAETWHRIAFAVDLSSPLSPAVAKWINGVKVGYQTGLSGGFDGRFSLDPVALLFGDEDGDQAETYVSSIQVWNGKLPDPLLALMGTPTADKLPGAITARRVPAGVEIYRTGGLGLEQADSVNGPWTEIVGAANPLVVPAIGASKYYRPKF
ncbi:MAG: immunoglobulin domain-containing protein [Verrucomicrobia bacterium]|nr:immunoglobulin domain-containing protein [Verrucomicrobiota bacterium]